MNLQKKLTSGEFLILAEMEPPKGVDCYSMLANAVRVKNRVDAFVVPEMGNAVMKMSSLRGCMLLQSRGLETVLPMCCRDRNRLALQADLPAAQALGISNVIAVTGEDPRFGDHHKARAVHDIDLLELLEGIQRLQAGKDMAGVELRGTPKYCVGSYVNAVASGGLLDIEIDAMRKKMLMGTEIEVIREMGVQFRTGVEIGKDVIISELREQGFKAFFVAIGAHECKPLGIEGETCRGFTREGST
jgi:methylenetetrahydrofolate reductase (NADPH)